MIVRGIAAFAATLLCAGCATQAQRQAESISTVLTTTETQATACFERLHKLPSAQSIAAHVPQNAAEPSLQQLADTSYPTDADIQNIYAVHNASMECRKIVLTGFGNADPVYATIEIGTFQHSDANALSLVERKLTFGQYNAAMQALTLSVKQQLDAEGRRLYATLDNENEQELADRQRAAQIYLQYLQNQQAIAAQDRPVTTNCTQFGTNLNCISR